MSAHLRPFILAVAIALLSGCVAEKSPTLYRSSNDRNPPTSQVLYISPFIALTKDHIDQNYGEAPLYCICQEHWLGAPELAGSTGDWNDKTLVASVSLMGKSKSGLLFGRGYDPDPSWAGWFDMPLVDANGMPIGAPVSKPDHYEEYFIITYDRVIFFREEKTWRDYLRAKWSVSHPKIETAGIFFEQEMGHAHQAY